MGNESELLINVVRTDKPKALIGLNQKVRGWLIEFPSSRHADAKATGEQADPNPLSDMQAERGNPVVLPEGKAHRKVSPKHGGQKKVEKAKAML